MSFLSPNTRKDGRAQGVFSPRLSHATCFTPLFRPSKTLQFLAECVPFAAGTIEAAGSFPLHVYQHLHEADLDYSLPPWRYNDIDVFVTAPHVYSEIVESFETALKEHGYHVTRRKIKRYSGPCGNEEIDRVFSQGCLGDIRLIDYTIEGIPFDVSIINNTTLNNVNEVTSAFDISVCAISCIVTDPDSPTFVFGWGTLSGFDPASDIISGIAHVQYSTENEKRIQKYHSRGFTKFVSMANVPEENSHEQAEKR
jgi:hypothetical protein